MSKPNGEDNKLAENKAAENGDDGNANKAAENGDDGNANGAAANADEGNANGNGAQGEGSDGDDGKVLDSHGQPGINKERHDKEVAELKKQIEELKADAAEAAESKAKRDEFEQKVSDLEGKLADSELSRKLEKVGCRSVKAAKALLPDYDGDIEKLRAAEPFLFEEVKPAGSTGFKPKAADPKDDQEELDKLFGIKK